MADVRDIEGGKAKATRELFGADWYAANFAEHDSARQR